MIALKLDQVASAMRAERIGGTPDAKLNRVCTDSRDVCRGDLFVAIRGDRYDGHEFVEEALRRGAVASLCDRSSQNKSWNYGIANGARAILLVDDTVKALGRLATHYRHSVMPNRTRVIAITGSNGKTTTKQMLHHVLSARMTGRCAPKSFNNHIGVPLTLLSAEAKDQYLIVEIGTNAPGEVSQLAEMARPDVAMITSIGEAHLSGLGSLAAVANEKATLLDHLSPHGSAMVNIDEPIFAPELDRRNLRDLTTVGRNDRAQVHVSEVTGSLSGSTCVISGVGRIHLKFPGLHHATNAAMALAVAAKWGLDNKESINRIESYLPGAGRTYTDCIGDVQVIDDSYNANPTGVESAVRTLAAADCRRRIFVLGDMLELGDESARLHRRVIRAMADARIDLLLTVGRKAGQAAGEVKNEGSTMTVIACDAAAAASNILSKVIAPGDAVWIKGSRANKLERIVDLMRARANVPAWTA